MFFFISPWGVCCGHCSEAFLMGAHSMFLERKRLIWSYVKKKKKKKKCCQMFFMDILNGTIRCLRTIM